MIRSAEPHDAGAIAAVHIRSWQRAYRDLIPGDYLASLDTTLDRRTEQWSISIQNGEPQVFVAMEDERLVGWIALSASRDEDAEPGVSGEVQALYVLEEYWGRGLGRLLWLKAREHLASRGFRAATLWVLVGNERAIRFYHNLGFTPVHSSKRTISRSGWTLEEVRYHLDF
jgi:ribosomal protein S18 acetylase RimI-like enzyme